MSLIVWYVAMLPALCWDQIIDFVTENVQIL